jgi:hypothetical protein
MKRAFATWLAVALAGIGAASFLPPARAEAGDDEGRERCAIRLGIALLGQSPSAELLGAAEPRALVPKLMATDAFRERFARFVNA